MAPGEPIFSAVSSNAHHIFTLLQCIGFASQVTVQLTPDGIRFSVEEGRVVQGLAFLDKALFTTYTFNQPADTAGNDNGEPRDNSINNDDNDNDNTSETTAAYPHFVISLAALLETLKIFGLNEASGSGSNKAVGIQQPNPSASNAFTAPALLLDRSCTLQYFQNGAPLSITLTEAGVKTICELTTYEPDSSGSSVDIPLQRDAIIMKIIMRSAWLHNAISELDATNPTILKVSASAKQAPFFALCASGGPFSESVVEFSIDNHHQNPQNGTQQQPVPYHKVLADDGTSRARARRAKLAPTVTETFLVSPPSSMGSRIEQNYRFPLIRKAARAMAVANKVSIRGDRQGVLSLQFMVELDDSGLGNKQPSRDNTGMGTGTGTGAGNVAFVDFRFVPLVNEDENGDEALDEDDEL